MEAFKSLKVQNTFNSYPEEYQKPLLNLRQLVFDTGKQMKAVDPITESLKWNQPSYTSPIGSPIRLGLFEKNKIALYFHCQTSLIENFRELFC